METLLVALVAAAFGAVPAYLAYKRGSKKDAVAAQAGIATAAQGTISQVIDGLNTLIENLQSDNAVLRDSLRKCEELKKQLADLSLRIP